MLHAPLWLDVSTHSRPKAAGSSLIPCFSSYVFQHTAARRRLVRWFDKQTVSLRFQHTAARRRLEGRRKVVRIMITFQHTAARRRLGKRQTEPLMTLLFQHTAARRRLAYLSCGDLARLWRFNTQPPEGGWVAAGVESRLIAAVSTHSRPKAAGTSIFC
mgnify:CR=1 FL=1